MNMDDKSVIDLAGGNAKHIWKQLYSILNNINEHCKKLLLAFGVDDSDMSPFIVPFTDNIMDLHDCFDKYMPKNEDAAAAGGDGDEDAAAAGGGDKHPVNEEHPNDNHNISGINSAGGISGDDNDDGAIKIDSDGDSDTELKGLCNMALSKYQEGLMKSIVREAVKNNNDNEDSMEDSNAIDVDADHAMEATGAKNSEQDNARILDEIDGLGEDPNSSTMVVPTEEESNATIKCFANIISSTDNPNWMQVMLPMILDGMSAFEMKGRDKGSISSTQKAGSLQDRWFGKKKSSPAKAKGGTISNIVKRDTVITVPVAKYVNGAMKETNKIYVVMAIFNKYYRKWNMTRDEVMWDPSKKNSKYRLSIRRVEYQPIFASYKFVKASEEEPRDTIFRMITLDEITSIIS